MDLQHFQPGPANSQSSRPQNPPRANRRRPLFLALFSLFALAAIPALALPIVPANQEPQDTKQSTPAEDRLKSLSLEELGKVEVTTYSKTPVELQDTPAAVYVITRDAILRSGVTSIADALRLAPGVEVGRVSSTTWAVGIRGLQSNFSKSVLVLIDGRNVYTPLFAGVYWDVQDMPLEDIERIEVLRGPGGTIWGPNAANGVINIITRSAKDTQGVMASALAGTPDRTIDDLQFGVAAHNTSVRFFGRGFVRGHEYHSDRINDDRWHQQRFGFRADHVAGPDEYLAEGDIYRGDSPHIVGGGASDDQTSGGDINLRWRREQASGNSLAVQAYIERSVRAGAIGETRNTFDIDVIDRLPPIARQRFSVGAGLHWSPYQISPRSPNSTLVPPRGNDHVHTVFLQDEVHLAPDLILTGGAKLQHNNYSGFDIQPSARLLWTGHKDHTFWMGLTRAVTTPSDLEERFLLEGALAPNVVIKLTGNPKFMSEEVVGYEVGYRGLLTRRVFLDLSGFWNHYEHLQSFTAPTPSVSAGTTYLTIQYSNQIDGATTGFELAPQFVLAPWWHIDSAWSYVNSGFHATGLTADISDSGSVPTYEKSTPRHTIFLQSRIDLPARFGFDQFYRYASDLPAQKVKAYQTMDLRLGRPIGRNLYLEAVGQNLFQPRHNEWGTGDPSQPVIGIDRAAYLKLSFTSARIPH